MRYFFSTGEASGEFVAVLLAQTIARIDPDAVFEGIGGARMRASGFTLWRDHAGWASLGPFAAIPRIPKLVAVSFATAWHVARTKPDVLVLVDFGAFNVRLARELRAIGYGGTIVDMFPPGAWLDSEKTARTVARVALPLSAFEHQRDFYAELGLAAAYFGHPLAGEYQMRAARSAPPPDGGTVAILPGSRPSELRHHAPLLIEAFARLRRTRPNLHGIAGAANDRAESELRTALEGAHSGEISVVRGTPAAIARADAAWVASGTALLECALSGVPSIAFYVVSPLLARYARRVYSGKFYTLPNLVLERGVIPELMQEDATPDRLARAMEELLRDPGAQYAGLEDLRDALGPLDALERCAAFIVAAARGNTR